MSASEFFPPRPDSLPTIYAYQDTNSQYAGLRKVGYTTVDAQDLYDNGKRATLTHILLRPLTRFIKM